MAGFRIGVASGDNRPVASPPYRLDELGWLQFERFCAELLAAESGLEPEAWRGAADSARTARVLEGLTEPLTGAQLVAPTLVVVAWLRPLGSRASAYSEERLREVTTDIVEDERRTGFLP